MITFEKTLRLENNDETFPPRVFDPLFNDWDLMMSGLVGWGEEGVFGIISWGCFNKEEIDRLLNESS